MKSKVVRVPIATWWEVDNYSVKIKPLDVVAITEKTVTYIDRGWSGKDTPHERRRNRDRTMYPTFDEAKTYAINRAKGNIESLKAQLQSERSELGQWESLKEPE